MINIQSVWICGKKEALMISNKNVNQRRIEKKADWRAFFIWHLKTEQNTWKKRQSLFKYIWYTVEKKTGTAKAGTTHNPL